MVFGRTPGKVQVGSLLTLGAVDVGRLLASWMELAAQMCMYMYPPAPRASSLPPWLPVCCSAHFEKPSKDQLPPPRALGPTLRSCVCCLQIISLREPSPKLSAQHLPSID